MGFFFQEIRNKSISHGFRCIICFEPFEVFNGVGIPDPIHALVLCIYTRMCCFLPGLKRTKASVSRRKFSPLLLRLLRLLLSSSQKKKKNRLPFFAVDGIYIYISFYSDVHIKKRAAITSLPQDSTVLFLLSLLFTFCLGLFFLQPVRPFIWDEVWVVHFLLKIAVDSLSLGSKSLLTRFNCVCSSLLLFFF